MNCWHTRITGTGRPLLLLNGIGASTDTWTPLAAQLADTRTLIAVDPPGVGDTPARWWPARMTTLAAELADTLTTLGHDSIDVLGFSWGGALAQQFANDYPERVERLILVSTTPGTVGQLPAPDVLALMSTPARYLSAPLMAAAAPRLYGGSLRHTPYDTGSTRPTVRGYLHQLHALAQWSNRRLYIQAPTLILAGDDDPIIPVGNAAKIAERCADATVRIIRDAGHLWLLTHPQRAARHIDDHLDLDTTEQEIAA